MIFINSSLLIEYSEFRNARLILAPEIQTPNSTRFLFDLNGTRIPTKGHIIETNQTRHWSIINLASIMGLVGGGFYPNFPYHATKGAVVNMTRALAAEWAAHGVRVNAIAPTFVKTNLTIPLRANENLSRLAMERTPMGRFAEPEELAGAFLFLASPASSMVTGHILAVDGGWTAI